MLTSAPVSCNGTCSAQGLVKFDPSLVNTKESSVAPSLSADAEPAACEDVHQFESTLASLPHTGYKAQQSQPQHPVRPKTSQSDKRPKKRVRKADDNAYNKSWDSDQSMQVPVLWHMLYNVQHIMYRLTLTVHVAAVGV